MIIFEMWPVPEYAPMRVLDIAEELAHFLVHQNVLRLGQTLKVKIIIINSKIR